MTIPNSERVQVIKWESTSQGGGEDDTFPTGIDSKEDALEARGYYGQPFGGPSDEEVWIARDGDDWKFRDKVSTSPATLTNILSRLTEADHESLTSLVHEIDETSYLEKVVSSGVTTGIIYWTDSNKTTKIREVSLQRVSGRISQVDIIQYDGGIEKQRMTGVISRDSSFSVDSIQWTKTVA